MKRIGLFLMIFMMTLTGVSMAKDTEVIGFRWVTRNDALVPFVRIVFDVNRLPKIDAVLSDDGKHLTVVLKKTKGATVEQSYVMNPEVVSSLSIDQKKRDMVVNISMPKAVTKERVKVFPLKKDIIHDKPYRVVIDIPKALPPPTFKTTSGLSDKTIVIDPGHGGTDPGAISPNNIYEKDITLPIALHLQKLLEKKGAKAILTRDSDRDVFGPYSSAEDELQARVDIAEKNEADVLLSIHIDSFVRPDVGGVSAYYHTKTFFDKLLADALHEHNVRVIGFGDRGVRSANFYLLVNSTMPSALVELGFLSNKDEEKQLQRKAVQKAFAETLADGLELYFERASKRQ